MLLTTRRNQYVETNASAKQRLCVSVAFGGQDQGLESIQSPAERVPNGRGGLPVAASNSNGVLSGGLSDLHNLAPSSRNNHRVFEESNTCLKRVSI